MSHPSRHALLETPVSPRLRPALLGKGALFTLGFLAVAWIGLPNVPCRAATDDQDPSATSPDRKPPELAMEPVLAPAADVTYRLEGHLGQRIDKVIDNWFLTLPESSPAILQVLRDRDRTPLREPLVPWAGEFAGKFLTSAQLTWRLTRDERLEAMIRRFVRDLIDCQAPNGYLGPFPAETRLTGSNWDVWGHYHCMLGLLLHYEDTGHKPALDACRKMADLLCNTFGPGGPTLTNDGSQGQMNMAVCHSLLLLYAKTGEERYRELADYIVHEAWNEPNAGQYLKAALEGKEVWEFPAHRWEALHDHQALAELYWMTGEPDYRTAFERIWRSCAKGDRHNTGGFTSGEGCVGSPYNLGAIETCCTVAWAALSLDMLRMTGESIVADEIEWSTLNSALAAIPFSGHTCAYNVPMDGTRTFGVELHWQAPKGGPDLNCCSVNAPRPLGQIVQWGLMQDASGGLYLNFYGPSTIQATLPSGNRVTLVQKTEYPKNGRVELSVTPEVAERFVLALRIPKWSTATEVKLNGEPVGGVLPGMYLRIDDEWKAGDVIELSLDFRPRFWAGEAEAAHKVSVYRGPILLAYDGRFDNRNPNALPIVNPGEISIEDASYEGPLEPWMFAVLRSGDVTIPVCDLASAGQTGNHYRTWLPARNMPPSPFHLVSQEVSEDGVVLRWTRNAHAETWTVVLQPDSGSPLVTKDLTEPEFSVSPTSGDYTWTVYAVNAHGRTEAANAGQAYWRFHVP